MFLGHYGLAFGAKRVAPAVSLAWLVFAAQLLDEIWPVFLLLGVEKVRIAPGLMAANSLDFVSYPYSHSLLASIVWGGLVAVAFFAFKHSSGGYFALQRVRTHALILGALVVSHWFLDLPMHRPDLQLIPGHFDTRGTRPVELDADNIRRRVRPVWRGPRAVLAVDTCARPNRQLGIMGNGRGFGAVLRGKRL